MKFLRTLFIFGGVYIFVLACIFYYVLEVLNVILFNDK